MKNEYTYLVFNTVNFTKQNVYGKAMHLMNFAGSPADGTVQPYRNAERNTEIVLFG